jgi:putative solute:sodium symporter small subunit
MLGLLLVWALVGPGLSILFVETLNRVRLGGFPLGFWFAQQGSILVFVVLIAVYAVVMNRLDDRHRRDLEAEEGDGSP